MSVVDRRPKPDFIFRLIDGVNSDLCGSSHSKENAESSLNGKTNH
jgi:hypothetical protein